jgi:signal transduction histidine kinase
MPPRPPILALSRLAIAWVACVAVACGQQPPADRVEVEGVPGVRASMDIAVDLTGNATLDEIRRSGRFDPWPGDIDAAGGSIPFWLRLDLEVPEAMAGRSAWLELLPGHLWDVRLHASDGTVQRAGLGVAADEHSHFGSTPRFGVRLEAPRTPLFVRVRTTAPRLLYVRLSSDDQLRRADLFDALLDGLFFGACLLIVLLSVVNQLSTGEQLFKAHALAIASAAIFLVYVDGWSSALVPWTTPETTNFLVAFTGGLMVVGTTNFSIRFLDLDSHRPRLGRVLRAVVWGGLAVTPLAFYEPFGDPIILGLFALRVSTGLALLVASVHHALRRRTLATSVVSASYIVFSSFETAPLWVVAGVLPAASWSVDLLMVGVTLQMLTAHVTLVQRYRSMHRARDKAERDAAIAGIVARTEQFERGDLRRRLEAVRDALNAPRAMLQRLSARFEAERSEPAALAPNRLAEVVRQLDRLARSAVEAGSGAVPLGRPDVHPVPLSEVVDEVLATWGLSVAKFKGAPGGRMPMSLGGGREGFLELVLPEREPTLLVDADLLQVAFSALFEHARDHAEQGSGVRLAVSSPVDGGVTRGIKVCVDTEGAVLSQWELARIFEPVIGAGDRTADLSFVRRIAQLHGGYVEATALSGRRTRVSMTLPILPSEG